MAHFLLMSHAVALATATHSHLTLAAMRVHETAPIAVVIGLVIGAVVWLVNRSAKKDTDEPSGTGELRKSPLDPEKITPHLASRTAEPQDADVTVFAPPAAPGGEEVIVQVIVHTPEREAEALARAQKVEPAAQPLASVPLTIQVRHDDEIKATLECDATKITEPVQCTTWNGRLAYVYFTMTLPEAKRSLIVRPTLRVFVNGMPAGKLIFKIEVRPDCPDLAPAPANESARAFRKAFLSYASQDRVEVLKAAQLLKALNMTFFQDVLTLSPGDRWERRLYEEIGSSDIFLLFWSESARRSEWVIREAEYALKFAKNAPVVNAIEIVPVLLEGPPPPLPPPSLSEIHFNDPMRHIIFAEETVAQSRSALQNAELDRLAAHINNIFLTNNGKLARLRDSTAIAQVGDEFRRFESVLAYRFAHKDNAEWPELKGRESKRNFASAAADLLREVGEAAS